MIDSRPLLAALLAALPLAALPLAALPIAAQAPAGLTGTLVVTNKAPATATVIDVASGRTLATLPTGDGPHEVVLSADGSTAVVTDYGSREGGSTLTVIDVPGLRVARTIPLGRYTRPHGIAFLPGDSVVAVTSESTQNVVLVHVPSGSVRRAAPTGRAGSHMVAVTGDGAKGYTGDIGSNTVTELDLRTGAALRTFDVPTEPEAINVTPDGREVWVGSNRTGKLTVVTPSSGAVATAAEGFSWPYRVLFTPDVKTVIVPDMRLEELRFLDRASRRELGRLPTPGAGPQGIAVTPDGRYAFQSLSRRRQVAIVDVSARTVVGTLAAGETPDGIAFTRRVVAGPR